MITVARRCATIATAGTLTLTLTRPTRPRPPSFASWIGRAGSAPAGAERPANLGVIQLPSFSLDLHSRTLSIGVDGSLAEMVLPEGIFADGETNLDRIAFDADRGVVRLGLPTGATAEVELALGGRPVDEVRADRPIIYLDQNKWSQLSAWEHGRYELPPVQAEAAEEIVRRVSAGQLLLPASAGHFVETTPLHGQRRQTLGATVLSHSRGWQMRNPIFVRREEIRRALSDLAPVAAEPFAPCADEVFTQPRPEVRPAGFPPELEEFNRVMVQTLALYDSIVDAGAIADEGGEAAAERWTRVFAQNAERLRDEEASRERSAEVVHELLLHDLRDEIVEEGRALGLSREEAEGRLAAGSPDLVSGMPYVSRMRGMILGRVRNVGQRWTANDLMDINCLGCAAGYADVVIGERNAIGYLRNAKPVPPGAALAISLADGLGALDELLAAR